MARRNKDKKIEFLHQVPLFAGLPTKHLGKVASLVDEVERGAGTVLARQGSMGQEMMLILDGKVDVDRNGKKLATLKAGDVFGEMSLIDSKERSATVTAVTDVDLLVLHRRDFQTMLADVPGFARHMLVQLTKRLREADTKLVD
ncbi:MAG TPA: cyclic nucleotide-binding domain-containing protein [Nitriliruptorales bacterium]